MPVKLDLNNIIKQPQEEEPVSYDYSAMLRSLGKAKEVQESKFSPINYDFNADQNQQLPQKSANVLGGKYPITQKFNNYNELYKGITADSRHKGLDIGTPSGTPVYAPSGGTVKTGFDKNWGNYALVTTSDGTTYRFSHLSSVDDLLKQAAQVSSGQLLGKTGSTGHSTGPHLDISVTRGGKFIDPLSIEAISRSLQ
jgi:murein DD-endopeptidase MepM/ murein hydrolase activator NlpD